MAMAKRWRLLARNCEFIAQQEAFLVDADRTKDMLAERKAQRDACPVCGKPMHSAGTIGGVAAVAILAWFLFAAINHNR